MFNAKNIVGWIGNMAVVSAKEGFYLVDWSNGKHIFVPKKYTEERK